MGARPWHARIRSAVILTVLLAGSSCGPADGPSATPAGAPDAIRLDQVGYLPDETKIAAVANAASEFTVRRSDGATVLRGVLDPPRVDADSGDTVRTADFSRLTQEGAYRLDVPGVGISHEFEISPSAYAGAFRLALRSFYGQRCGTAVDLVEPTQAERMTAFWGDDSWKPILYQPAKQLGLFGTPTEKLGNPEVAEAFRERLRTHAGFLHVPEPVPMRNRKGAVVYYLYFATHKGVADHIVREIFDKYAERARGGA